ncbi:hypothetical protein HELRODRAFT_184469 [Helobdella robusta]|uniref:Uncharacterized protein n=1 Tax=Helobdella robusta TaxID=6412 RepID=T1FL97_HELRO|nr:hypothetical protein HELRODRAFT_184469 [Helobdella robusta]ESN95067.1 hypothetical protein HELRODRAFT_184469 [Helobdella robusta]
MAAPMDDSTADAPAIPVGLKKILIKDREFINVANSWVDKWTSINDHKTQNAYWFIKSSAAGAFIANQGTCFETGQCFLECICQAVLQLRWDGTEIICNTEKLSQSTYKQIDKAPKKSELQERAEFNFWKGVKSYYGAEVVVGQPGTAYEIYPSHEVIFVEEKVLKHKYVPLIPLAKLIIRMIIAHDLYDIPESKGKYPKKIESLEKKFRALKAAVGSLYTEAVSWRDILYTKKVKFVNQKVSSALWNRIGAKGSNCPFSVRTKFGKQTNIAALFKKITKLYGKLASSK